jgi:hypothetical protein
MDAADSDHSARRLGPEAQPAVSDRAVEKLSSSRKVPRMRNEASTGWERG